MQYMTLREDVVLVVRSTSVEPPKLPAPPENEFPPLNPASFTVYVA